MAKKEALRDLQARLAERMQAGTGALSTANWLAVEAGGHGFLLPLAESGEIFTWTALVGVPRTQPWFLGVANLRGRLHGVVDLGAFLGVAGPAASEQSRLVAFGAGLDLNCALRVDRLAGLRSREQLRRVELPGERPAFAGDAYDDAGGRRWQELLLAALARDESFLKIAQP